eukprot:CAMPEP_0198239992 /NCGR_PEP_ID=MMETSP1446-20131203/5240_1 /TAXON_ID=1461542 ORGANISM="Unidentified sp, Strain CCMP2111" /NCGR_SAMPLE_ID=MMETSP1446 /ASSEMBLY_ACC=CAM_ASM_001112 /LENGTH=260 /DNA_ID=CAMNT_0043922671 /DNA_START=51 /DNA_END=833 /DNA_ORIENTATION=+
MGAGGTSEDGGAWTWPGTPGSGSDTNGAVKFGPEVPEDVPDWVKDLYKQAHEFPEETYLQELLKDTGGEPRKIEMNARRKLAESTSDRSTPSGVPPAEAQMKVRFDEVDPFSLWVWFEFYDVPNEAEREMLQNVLESWFILGKLGSFNALNLQLSDSYESGPSFFNYDVSELESSLPAMFHELREAEFEGSLGRTWVNMGTCDEIALDMLINALHNFSRECCSIRELTIGGQSVSGWQAPKIRSVFDQAGDLDMASGDLK